MSFSDLAIVEKKWLKLFYELRARPDLDRGQIAAPFLSVAPPGYDPSARPSILYVGKATDKKWNPNCAVRSLNVKNTREYTRHFILNEAEEYNAGFWQFARDLSKAVAAATNQYTSRFPANLVWTNLCKIGVVKGTPQKRILLAQSNLAVETLRLEIAAYRPKLIVFVIGDFGEELIACLLDDCEWKSWRENSRHGYWWRESIGKTPPILWTGHPQGKLRDLREVWLKQAVRLATR
jgi:hypothetical protein